MGLKNGIGYLVAALVFAIGASLADGELPNFALGLGAGMMVTFAALEFVGVGDEWRRGK